MDTAEAASPRPRLAYLDWNVISGIQAGDFPNDTLTRIVALRRDGSFKFPWSSAHLQEMRNCRRAVGAKGDTVVEELLDVLGQLSGDEFWHFRSPLFTGGRRVLVQGRGSPRTMEPRYRGEYAGGFDELLATLWSDDVGSAMRASTQLDPRMLNNLGPAELTQHLREHYTSVFASPEAAQRAALAMMRGHPFRFLWIAFWSMFYRQRPPPASFDDVLTACAGQGEPDTPSEYSKLLDLLDTLGYHPDKRRAHRHTGIARTWDGHHACYGSLADCFVTGDRRLAKRSAVIYYWKGVKTRIVSLDEFLAAEATNHGPNA